MRRFGDPRRRSWASDHERARQRAAEQLSLPLPAAEAGWLAAHLRVCPSCARVAAQYTQHRDQLRKLRPVDPPRDLWARTSAAFDQVDRDFARRETANGSGPLARHGVRSRNEALRNLRALRSERQATALARFRSVPRPNLPAHVHADRRAPSHGWALPFAALAAFTVMVATGGGLLLTIQNGPPSDGLPASSGPLSAAVSPGATPITVGPGEVAWLTPNASGGYSLNLANVERVCPDQALPDCAPLAGDGSRHLPSLAAQPGTVVQSPSKGQLVVVDKSAKGSGGSVYVVAVPARVETPETSPTATEAATPAPTETASAATAEPTTSEEPTASEPAATPEPSGEPTPSTEPAVTTEPTPSIEPTASVEPAPGETAPASPFASLDVTPTPSADGGQTVAIISDVVMVGESAAYSPDGTMFAFSARPADGRHGSDIYVWRVGEPQAHAITTDHASIFSGWIGGLLVGSRPALGASAAPSVPGPAADPSTAPVTEAPAANPSESPVAADPNAPTESSVARTDHAGDFGAAGTSDGAAAADASGAVAGPASWQVTTSQAVFRAFVSLISPSQDPAATAEPSSSAAASPTEAPAGGPPTNEPAAIPVSFLIDPSTGVEQPLGGVPAWRPVVDPTGRLVVYWSGALRYDSATASWVPAAGQLFLAAWGDLLGTSAIGVAAVPLLPGDPNGSPSGDWDIRWDTTGTHLAVWIADGIDPSVGRLSLLAVDPTAVPLAVPTILLHDAPGLAGFSIGDDRLAWATPPGQDGEGSHLQVLAWSGENAGLIVSEPASGSDAVIVVR